MTNHSKRRARAASLIVLPLAFALALAGCASDEQAGAGSSTQRTDASLYKDAVAKAKDIAGNKQLGGSIEYIGPNGGAEGEVLQSVYKAFTEATGTKVNYTGTQDINSIVQSRVQAGNPPEVADLQIGVAQGYAEQGKLMNLSDVIGTDELKANYSQGLLDGASHDGKVFGVYQGFNNFMLWYNPEQYTGPKDPKTWQEIVDWTNAEAAKGTPVWCLAQEAGGGQRLPGRSVHREPVRQEVRPRKAPRSGVRASCPGRAPRSRTPGRCSAPSPTTTPRSAAERQGALSAAIATGYNGLVAKPATCQIALWGSWVPGLIGSGVEPGEEHGLLPDPRRRETTPARRSSRPPSPSRSTRAPRPRHSCSSSSPPKRRPCWHRPTSGRWPT